MIIEVGHSRNVYMGPTCEGCDDRALGNIFDKDFFKSGKFILDDCIWASFKFYDVFIKLFVDPHFS